MIEKTNFLSSCEIHSRSFREFRSLFLFFFTTEKRERENKEQKRAKKRFASEKSGERVDSFQTTHSSLLFLSMKIICCLK